MGMRSVEFGSVYLFINGFRIPPYGEIDNDSFGLEMRKGQGQRRYLGGREIILMHLNPYGKAYFKNKWG